MSDELHAVDIAVILLYAGGLLALGLFGARRNQDHTDYLLASRRLTLLPFTASLVATWYGGILGVGEFTYRYGISNWIILGLPYYIFALLFALFIAGRIRHDNFATIPDRLRHHYGETAGVIGAGLVAVLTTPAPYVLSCALLITSIFEIALLPAILLATAVSLVYVYNGGFRSVVRTDILQFMLMFVGFALLVFTCFREVGGLQAMKAGLPPLHLAWHGGNTTQVILVWFFIALWTFVDPGFYQRCAAAESPTVAKRGILTSIGFWVIFDFLTLSAGLYSRLLLPEGSEAAVALPALGLAVLPPIAKGLFFAGLLATIMSTIDSFGFISGITIGRDILWRMGRLKDEVTATKIGLLLMAVMSLLLAWLVPSVVKLWYSLGSVVIPGLLIPFLATFWLKRPLTGVPVMMLLATAVSFSWLVLGLPDGRYPLGLEPFYPGFMVSMVWTFVSHFTTKPRSGLS